MAEHYPRNTVEASAWCLKCQKSTMHRIDGVRKGPCIPCTERLEAEHKAAPAPPAEQKKLF